MPSATYDRGIPASCGEMRLEGRAGRPRCLGETAWPVTHGPSRNTGGAAIGDTDATHESVFYPGAGRPVASLVQEAGGLPAVYATAWCGSGSFRRRPAGPACLLFWP